jgi:hypothetical protein
VVREIQWIEVNVGHKVRLKVHPNWFAVGPEAVVVTAAEVAESVMLGVVEDVEVAVVGVVLKVRAVETAF